MQIAVSDDDVVEFMNKMCIRDSACNAHDFVVNFCQLRGKDTRRYPGSKDITSV